MGVFVIPLILFVVIVAVGLGAAFVTALIKGIARGGEEVWIRAPDVREGEFYRHTFWQTARMTFPLLPFVKPFTMLLRRRERPQDGMTTWVRRFDQ